MGAFWSAQDIADQKASRLFSVLGKITSEQPEILITAGSNQQEVKLNVEDVFDLQCEKLHEDSDYSVSPEMINNITEYKYVTPVNTWNKNYNTGYNNTANKSTTKPATSGGNYYGYNNLKSTLITKLHTYDTSYSLSSTKIQEICLAFLDFLEDATLNKDTTYSSDLNAMAEILNNITIQYDATFDLILDQFNLPNLDQTAADSNPLTTTEKDNEAVDNYALQSYTPNWNS